MFISEDSSMVEFGWKYLSRHFLIRQTFLDLSGDHVCRKSPDIFFRHFKPTVAKKKSVGTKKTQNSHTLTLSCCSQLGTDFRPVFFVQFVTIIFFHLISFIYVILFLILHNSTYITYPSKITRWS